ncbi:PAS domain-containing protein [Pseudarthrobacter sp. So.54]
MLNAAADGVYGVDKAGRIMFVNQLLCELIGIDRADALVGQDHHRALCHSRMVGDAASGTSTENSEIGNPDGCALCAAVGRMAPADGDLCLGGVNQKPLPVGFTSRPLTEAADTWAP